LKLQDDKSVVVQVLKCVLFVDLSAGH